MIQLQDEQDEARAERAKLSDEHASLREDRSKLIKEQEKVRDEVTRLDSEKGYLEKVRNEVFEKQVRLSEEMVKLREAQKQVEKDQLNVGKGEVKLKEKEVDFLMKVLSLQKQEKKLREDQVKLREDQSKLQEDQAKVKLGEKSDQSLTETPPSSNFGSPRKKLITEERGGQLVLSVAQLSLILPNHPQVDLISMTPDLSSDLVWDSWKVSHVSVKFVVKILEKYGDVFGQIDDLVIKQQLFNLEKVAIVEESSQDQIESKEEMLARVGLCRKEDLRRKTAEIERIREEARAATRLRSGVTKRRKQPPPADETASKKKKAGKRR